MFDCPGHTSNENSHDLDVPKVILRFYCQQPMTGKLYLECVLFLLSAVYFASGVLGTVAGVEDATNYSR